jgi:predicted SAM-dependent methyltransferase
MTLKQRLGKWLIPRLPMSRFTFDLLRLELNAWRVRLAWKLLPRRWIRLSRLRKLRGIYVNVASGPFLLDGFVHLDLFGGAPGVIPWDCGRSLPFADASCKGIRVEHFLEHIEPREDLPSFLGHCRRALQPGGALRVVVPDVEKYLRAYSRNDPGSFAELGFSPPFPADLPTRLDLVNHAFHQWHEHRWGYDFETLSDRLRRAGFSEVVKEAYGESVDATLAQDRPSHAPYSLYVDAIK